MGNAIFLAKCSTLRYGARSYSFDILFLGGRVHVTKANNTDLLSFEVLIQITQANVSLAVGWPAVNVVAVVRVAQHQDADVTHATQIDKVSDGVFFKPRPDEDVDQPHTYSWGQEKQARTVLK